MDRTFWPAILLLLAVFAGFETTGADLAIQDHLYDFDAGTWVVDAKSAVPRLLFYTGPRTLLWVIALFMIGVAVAPAPWRSRLPFADASRRDIWILLGSMAAGPILISGAKMTTNVFTPKETRRYGGIVPYVKVLESYPENDRPKKRGHGFPAGHASGGFALMALAGLARTPRGRLGGFLIGLAAGGIMGVYQMCRGAHFLSHTVISALVCWIVFLALRRVFHPGAASAT